MGRKKKSVADVMKKSEFSFADLKKEPATVSVVLPKSAAFNPFDALPAKPTAADIDAVADAMVKPENDPHFREAAERLAASKPRRKSKTKRHK
jgi:type IV secretory pathway TraG/TraD family ATPase VirD4